MTYYGRWTYKYEEAARRGAVGMLIVHETAPASYGWDDRQELEHQHDVRHRAREPRRGAHADGSLDPARRRRRPFSRAGLDFDALKKQAQTRNFKPVELKGTLLRGIRRDAQVIKSKTSSAGWTAASGRTKR